MSIEITLDTLPAYLRGEGREDLADMIERAGRDSRKLAVALDWAATELDGQALEVVERFAGVVGNAATISEGRAMTAAQLAQDFGINRRNIYRWIKRPGFPAPIGRAGNSNLWDVEEVVEWEQQADFKPRRPRGS